MVYLIIYLIIGALFVFYIRHGFDEEIDIIIEEENADWQKYKPFAWLVMVFIWPIWILKMIEQ